MGNLSIKSIMSHIMMVFYNNISYNHINVVVSDIDTMIPMYEFKSNSTTNCARFIGCMISQDPEMSMNKVFAINTTNGKVINIAIGTNSKIPTMKNMLRRISNLVKVFGPMYDDLKVTAIIDSDVHEVNGRLIDWFIANQSDIFGGTIRKVSCNFLANKDFVNKKFKCEIKVNIEVEK